MEDPQEPLNIFTEEALKSQDGKKIPLTLVPGGPVIGEATLKFNPESGNLEAHMVVTDPEMTEFINLDAPSIIFKKES